MSLKLFDLTGKRALITGGTQGLGFDIAKGLGEAGATIILNARNPEKLNAGVEKMKSFGIDTYGSLFDVSSSESIEAAIEKIENEIGAIDILVNNAGIIKRTPLEEMTDEDFEAVINTNLIGVFKVSKAVAKRMIARKKGKIINMNSMMSELGRPNVGAYAASKGGLKMLTKNMAAEWAKHNIQVNGIGPGYFITELTKPLVNDEKFNSFICNRTPANRWGLPEELAGAAIYLASDASNFVNGHILYVDGGILAVL
jgi:gluconate 5-dehydrogenase